MGFWPNRAAVAIALPLLLPPLVRADGREGTIAAIRAGLAEAGKLTIQLSDTKTPGGGGWAPVEDIERRLKERPRDLLREAIDQAIRGGSKEERIGALNIYSTLVYMKKEPLNPVYHKVLLELLAEDDLRVAAYTGSIVSTLREQFPSRETVFAFMDAAKRALTHEDRVSLLLCAAHLCRIEWLDIQPESRGPRVEKVLSDFEDWFARNRERIQFTKDGQFRLSGREARVERPELSDADRKRIRENPTCVLRLMSMTTGGEDERGPADELNSQCGAALFGREGAEAYGTAMSESGAGSTLLSGTQANLASLAGQYPVVDAGILAAIYVAAYGKDSETVEIAKETLIQVGPSEVRRLTKGEPRWLRKRAEDLANPEREGRRD